MHEQEFTKTISLCEGLQLFHIDFKTKFPKNGDNCKSDGEVRTQYYGSTADTTFPELKRQTIIQNTQNNLVLWKQRFHNDFKASYPNADKYKSDGEVRTK